MSESGGVAKRKLVELAMAVISLIFGLYMLPIIASTVNTVSQNSTGVWNFTGATAALTIIGLLPFIFSIVLAIHLIAEALGYV